MELLFPQFLYGLFALGIPILVHLFNFRRFKTLPFPTTRFLKEVKEQSQKRLQLRHILILISRLMLITALVIAFCQPVIPLKENAFRPSISAIVIDNSFSMDLDLSGGRALDIAKKSAFEIVSQSPDDERFYVFSADISSETNQSFGKREALEKIKQMEASSTVFDLAAISERISWLGSDNGQRIQTNCFSDLQNVNDAEDIRVDSTHRLNLFYLKPSIVSNLSVDSCWFKDNIRKIEQEEELFYRVKNYGNEEREFESKLQIDGKILGKNQISLNAGSELISSFRFKVSQTGKHRGMISLEDSPIEFDNHLRFSYTIDQVIEVLYVTEEKDSLWTAFDKLFKIDSNFRMTTALRSSIEYDRINTYPLVIVAGLLKLENGFQESIKSALKAGSSVCIIPDSDSDLNGYNELMSAFGISPFGKLNKSQERTKKIELESSFFQGVFENIPENVDLPIFNSYFQSGSNQGVSASLMSLLGGSELLCQARVYDSQLYLFRADISPSNSNFTRHALFVPTMLQMAINSRKSFGLYSVIEDRLMIPKTTRIEDPEQWVLQAETDSSIYLPTVSQDFFIIPDFAGSAGFYQLKNRNDGRAFDISINQQNKESDLSSISEELLKSLQANEYIKLFDIYGLESEGSIQTASADFELWKVFVLLALLFVVIEIILIKL